MAVWDTLTSKAAQKVLHLFSIVCIYRTKTQTMAIDFKRNNVQKHPVLYHTNIVSMHDHR